MAKILMPEIAHLLGVELDEVFLLCDKSRFFCEGLYKITEKQFLCASDIGWVPIFHMVLKQILDGELKIVKLPYKPKYHEWYYTICEDFNVRQEWWENTFEDYARFNLGACFPAETAAEIAVPVIYKKLTGKELRE